VDKGTILRSTGPVSYIVKLLNGLMWRRHQDQLKSCVEPKTVTSNKLPETVHQDMLFAPFSSVSSVFTDSIPVQSSDTKTPALTRRYLQRTM